MTADIYGGTHIYMKCTANPKKRADTFKDRGLDLELDAPKVFAGRTATVVDDRFDYGEVRYITAGFLGNRMVVMVWTPRGADRHIISMRHCHEKEARRWTPRLR